MVAEGYMINKIRELFRVERSEIGVSVLSRMDEVLVLEALGLTITFNNFCELTSQQHSPCERLRWK